MGSTVSHLLNVHTALRHAFSASHNEDVDTLSGDDWARLCYQRPVLDSTIAYYDSAPDDDTSEVVIFLHGNPTYSYLWRNVIPHVRDRARCIAPDLIGMGLSGKNPKGAYKFQDHYDYLDAWVKSMELPSKISVVCHDWGSGLAFHWCRLNPERVRCLVHMESVVMPATSWKQWPLMPKIIFRSLRSGGGDRMVLKENFFVERLLPANTLRKLKAVEMEAYRQPYLESGEGRRPMLTWPREIPFVSEGPYDILKIVQEYGQFMKTHSQHIPKLFIEADPGVFSRAIHDTALSWPNTKTVKVKGLHYLQEDSPTEIGKSIASFLQDVYNNI